MTRCAPRVRQTLEHDTVAFEEEGYAFTRRLLARRLGSRGDVQLDHCHGKPTILTARKREAEAAAFDLRSGFLTWDTGTAESTRRTYQGRLYAYDPTIRKREDWLLPLKPGIEGDYRGEKGTFGYSTHTANMVFWLADAEPTEGRAPGVKRWTVFAARR